MMPTWATPVTAEDEDELTYSLVDSTDARSFTIARDTAQIRVASGVTIDYETKRSYTVVVKAKDASNSEDTLRVTITVTDVDEAPVISGDAPGEYAENSTGTVADFNAVDPERTRIVWTLSGADAGDFSISSTGVLTFNASPDFEDPKGGGDEWYIEHVRGNGGSQRHREQAGYAGSDRDGHQPG